MNKVVTTKFLPSIPIWSPDGSQAIFTDQPNAQLGLLQGDRRTILFDSSADTQALQLYYSDRQTLIEGEAGDGRCRFDQHWRRPRTILVRQ